MLSYISYCIQYLSSSSYLTRSFSSTSSNLVIFISISNGGCDEFVHHLETVVGEQPNSLDSQRLDFFFSTSITFKRLRSLLAAISYYFIIATKIYILFDITTKILNNLRNLMNLVHFTDVNRPKS